MKNLKLRIVSMSLIIVYFITITTFASSIIYDKTGRVVDQITKPTAAAKVDEDMISDAERRKIKNIDTYVDSSKNVDSSAVLFPKEGPSIYADENLYYPGSEKTVIRHLVSINHVEDKYELIEDRKVDRLMLKILLTNAVIYAKNGFYEINDKTYYFDEDGHMVLGPCIDNTGKEYFFSYETGELLKN